MAKKIDVREGDTVTIRVRTSHLFGEDYDRQVVLMLPSGPQAIPLNLLDIVKVEKGNNWPNGD